MPTIDIEVLDTIHRINPWFKTGVVPEKQIETFRRREFPRLTAGLGRFDMAQMIIGGRRVGKSVLMYQTIADLLSRGVDKKHILFIQGDNTILRELAPAGRFLYSVFSLYQKYIIETEFSSLKEPVYIFIDEAHQIPNWDTEVKSYIDLKYNIKFVITGSSSFELRKGSQTPLTGRVNIETLSPMSFADFCRFRMEPSDRQKFEAAVTPLSEAFKAALYGGDAVALHEVAAKALPLLTEYRVGKHLEKYLFIGGFPHVVAYAHDNKEEMSKYLKDLLSTTIAKDIQSQVGIRESQAFERLMVNLCIGVGQRIGYDTLAKKLGIDERSVSRYIDYYMDSHWASISSPYVFHKKADTIKAEKKVYIIDNGVVNVLAFKDENDLKTDGEYRGHIIENAVHNHLLSSQQAKFGIFQSHVPFWICTDQKEIDFILEIDRGVAPIEVKSKNPSMLTDTGPTREFLEEKTSAKLGIITTEDHLALEGRVVLLPHSLFLLLL